jgi:hypothetical protein
VQRHPHAYAVDGREILTRKRALGLERRRDRIFGAANAAQNASPIVLKT